MITRRSFLAVLAGLPFVGKLIPTKLLELNDANYRRVYDAWEPMTLEGKPVFIENFKDSIFIAHDQHVYIRPLKPMDDDATIKKLAAHMRKVQQDAINEVFPKISP